MQNKYKVTPSSNLKDVSRRLRSVRHLELIEPVLDAGGDNNFARELGIINFVEGDLNFEFSTAEKFNTITSFEVIEHLQNPLLYLKHIYKALNTGGTLYLTTPVKWTLKGQYHFHEFSKEEIIFCLEKVGFYVLEVDRIQTYNLANFGIRPLIRKLRDLIYGQSFIITAIK